MPAARWCWLALLAWQCAWWWGLPPPLGPRNAWLALVMALPLAALAPGVWRLGSRALVWAGFLAVPYFVVGVMEAWSNPPQRWPATAQFVLAAGFITLVSVPGWRRRRR